MTTESRHITVAGFPVEIVRKAIKNLHLGVYPPNGRVRIAAPLSMHDDALRLAVIGKLGWIKRQKAAFAAQPRQGHREMVSGESHYFLGHRYRLRVMDHDGAGRIRPLNKSHLGLYVRPGLSSAYRERLLHDWYRSQLSPLLGEFVRHWQTKMRVPMVEWRIRRMKTKWGTCNVDARRLWFNLELAKRPVQCIEYVVVHELVHLLERHHTDRFRALMDLHMPQWQFRRTELNRGPLGHETWGCGS